jgi:hypothetical protein
MGHRLTYYDHTITLRIEGGVNSLTLSQDLHNALNAFARQGSPITIILDLTLANALDHQTKATLYRAFQHHALHQVGICGVAPDFSSELREWMRDLQQRCRVAINTTEADVLVDLGLSVPPAQPRKLSGLLSHLNRS